MNHSHHQHHAQPSSWQLALSATLHCLLGCGLGDVAGMVIGTGLNWDNLSTNLLSISLGIVGGFALGLIPLLRARYALKAAVRVVLVTEGVSILVMEATIALVQSRLGIVAHGHLADPLFWLGMGLALAAGFLVALPLNFWLVRRGIRHAH
jgi:hypothetical protein